MHTLTKNTCYSFTPNELENHLHSFLLEKYQYDAELNVHFDTEITHPIELTLEENDSQEFLTFWTSLNTDLLKIDDDDDELGHKLLLLMLGHDITEYVFDKVSGDREYLYEDEGPVYVIGNEESSIPLRDSEYVEQLANTFEEELNYFVFDETSFHFLENDDVELFSYVTSFSHGFLYFFLRLHEKDAMSIALHFPTNNTDDLKVDILSYCSSIEITQVAKKLSQLVYSFVKEKMSSFSCNVILKEEIINVGIPINEFKGLTLRECAILSLYATEEMNYQQIAEKLHLKSGKFVDNDMQRIKLKLRNGEVDDEALSILER